MEMRTIPAFGGRYSVSENGTVLSHPKRRAWGHHSSASVILKNRLTTSGYHQGQRIPATLNPMTTPHQSSPAVPAEAEQVRGPGFAVPPGSALRAAAARLGVEKLNCKTCVHGYEDSDGEPGASYYCGMTCSKHDLPETYLEDNGVDIETEKSCWHPDFWKCETPEIMDMIDGTDASMKRAGKAWRKLIAEIHAEG